MMEEEMLGPLGGKFLFKKRLNGSLDKSKVVCQFCYKVFSYHRSNSSLRYHLNAKHAAASRDSRANVSIDGPGPSIRRQPTVDRMTAFAANLTKRRRAELLKNRGGSTTPSQVSAEEEGRLKVEVLPGGACIEPLSGSESSFISVSGHPVLLLPVTKTEPESPSGDETDVSDSHIEGDMNSSSFQERTNSTRPRSAGRGAERPTDDIRALYCSYLKKEMENRDQEMAFRALKMKKLEKEILLLDKQLM